MHTGSHECGPDGKQYGRWVMPQRSPALPPGARVSSSSPERFRGTAAAGLRTPGHRSIARSSYFGALPGSEDPVFSRRSFPVTAAGQFRISFPLKGLGTGFPIKPAQTTRDWAGHRWQAQDIATRQLPSTSVLVMPKLAIHCLPMRAAATRAPPCSPEALT